MFKPTKKQHVVNKAYADSNSGGGGTAPLIIRYDHTEVNDQTYTHYFDKTWQEVANALTNFTPVYIHRFERDSEYVENPLRVDYIDTAYQENETFGIGGTIAKTIQADSADGALYFTDTGDD